MIDNNIKSSLIDFGVKVQSPEIDKKDIVGNATAYKTYVEAILSIYTTGLHTAVSIAEALSELSQELAGVEIITKPIEEIEGLEDVETSEENLETSEELKGSKELESKNMTKEEEQIESIEEIEEPKK